MHDDLSERRMTTLVASLGALVVAVGLGLAIGSDHSGVRPTAAADTGPDVPRTSGPVSTPTATPSPRRSATLPDIPVRDATAPIAPDPVVAPVAVALPTLGVDLPVLPVGVTADGQMQVPAQAEQAGWYEYGPAPGSAQGSAVIAAHVDSVASRGLGPFARLKDLAVGDAVTVRLADGSTVTYAVERVDSMPKTDVVWHDVFTSDGPPRLVLITCGGRWQPAVRHYANNIMVQLTPVGHNGPP